jgi:hypothetical protein
MMAPHFEVDPLWPMPLPNHWVLGSTIGVSGSTPTITSGSSIAARRRSPQREAARDKTGECCAGAPPVLEFDQAGNLLRHGADPAKAMSGPIPTTASSSTTKAMSGSAAMAVPDSQVLKFTKDGKFLLQVGKKGARASASAQAGVGEGPVAGFAAAATTRSASAASAKIFVDQQANEAYIADGYLNKRVAVLDADTGKMKRWWGAYGNKPTIRRSPLTIRRALRRSNSTTRCTAPTCRRPHRLCVRPRRRPPPAVHARRQVHQGSVLRDEHQERRLGVGHRVLEGPAAALHLHGRRREREGEDRRPPDAEGDHHLR